MEDVSCKAVQASLFDANDEVVAAHLANCRDCRMRRAEGRSLSSGLRNLPRKAISPILETRLRIIASRERNRLIFKRTLKARISDRWSRLRVSFDNLLRPLAVPAAGGILASVFCFGAIVDTLTVRADWGSDIPVGLFTQVMIDDVSPFGGIGKDAIVQLSVDSRGRITDFVPQGQMSPEQMHDIGNLVLYSTFKPATSFGQRISGKIMVAIRHIDVRG